MKNEYEATKKFAVYSLTDTHNPGVDNIYGLQNAHSMSFDTFDDAVEWVQLHGTRQIDYTIIEIFRKP